MWKYHFSLTSHILVEQPVKIIQYYTNMNGCMVSDEIFRSQWINIHFWLGQLSWICYEMHTKCIPDEIWSLSPICCVLDANGIMLYQGKCNGVISYIRWLYIVFTYWIEKKSFIQIPKELHFLMNQSNLANFSDVNQR